MNFASERRGKTAIEGLDTAYFSPLAARDVKEVAGLQARVAPGQRSGKPHVLGFNAPDYRGHDFDQGQGGVESLIAVYRQVNVEQFL